VIVACAGGHGATTGPAAFQIFYPDAPATGATAHVGKKFYAKPAAQCTYDNGREGHWAITGARVDTGELPPGITLEDGTITGTPTKPGAFTAKLALTGVTCAGKAHDDQHVDVTITVK
jgi:hypothetical protein